MKLTRRSFMATAGAAPFACGMPAWARLDLGAMQIDTLSDGFLTLPNSMVFGPMPQAELAPLLAQLGQDPETARPPCNVTLLRHQDRVVLFDVGAGPDFMSSAGELPQSLDSMGVSVDDITDIVFTHAHPDHIWGLLDDFDDPLFPNARYFMGQTEFDFWMDPGTVDRIEPERQSFAVGAKRRIEVIADQIALIKDGHEVLPGVMARASFGHTPGHMAFELRDGSNAVMIVGDAIANGHVAFAKPEWFSGSDQDQQTGANTRKMLLDQLAGEQTTVIGFHLPDGGIGRVEHHEGAYRFVPMAG